MTAHARGQEGGLLAAPPDIVSTAYVVSRNLENPKGATGFNLQLSVLILVQPLELGLHETHELLLGDLTVLVHVERGLRVLICCLIVTVQERMAKLSCQKRDGGKACEHP